MSSSSPNPSNPPNPTVKRACDSCHRRKVKCIGEGTKPCKNCISAGLTCTYNAIPQKKGPKGSRAKVLSELRETQRQSQLATGLPNTDYRFDGRNMSPSWSKTNGLLSPEAVNICVDVLFSNYAALPILHRQRTQQIIANMDHSIEAYCMMLSLCGYLMIQPNMILPAHIPISPDFVQLSHASYGHLLLEETVRLRKSYNYFDNPTTASVITSYFLFGGYYFLDKQIAAWFYLREATTHAIALGMHDEETYKIGDAIETSRRRRLYWLLFITERAYALQKRRPLTLAPTIHTPTLNEDPTEHVNITGFIRLVSLFKPFDYTFIALCDRIRSGCLPSWLAQLQAQLSEALPAYLENTETPGVDFRVSQQWLNTMVDLVAMPGHTAQQTVEVQGADMLEKMFDFSCILSDIMTCVPYEHHAYEMSIRDHFHRFLNTISTLRGSHSRYLVALMSKFSEIFPNAQIGMQLSISPGPGTDLYENSVTSSATSTRNDSTPFDSLSSIGIPLRAGPTGHGQYSDIKHSPLQANPHGHSHSPMPHHNYVYTTSTMPYPDSVAVVGMGVTTSATPAGIVVQDMYGIPEAHGQPHGYGE